MMAFRFGELPFDLCREVVWNWIGHKFKTISDHLLAYRALDIAYCCREERALFLEWIRGMEANFPLPCRYQLFTLLQWLTSRELRISVVEIEVYDDCEKVIDQLLVCAASIGREDLFRHTHTLNMVERSARLSFDYASIVSASRLVSLLPAVQVLEILSCSLVDLDQLIRVLPNPHLLDKLSVLILRITEHTLPAQPWWTLTSHLKQLYLSLNDSSYPNLISQMCSSLPNLQDLTIKALLDDRALDDDVSAPMELLYLHSLALYYIPDPKVTNYILRGCPNLRKLTLVNVALNLSSIHCLVTTVLPTLQELRYEDQVIMDDEDERSAQVKLWLRSHFGQQLSSSVLSPRALRLRNEPMPMDTSHVPPFSLLEYLWLDKNTTAHLQTVDLSYTLFDDQPGPVAFLLSGRDYCLLHLTSLELCDDTPFRVHDWATILSFPTLKTLYLWSGVELAKFEEGLIYCIAKQLQSSILALQWSDSLCAQSCMSVLLPIVCPHLVDLQFIKESCSHADIVHLLLSLPNLKSLSVGEYSLFNAPTESPSSLTALEGIRSDLWGQIAAVSSCTDLTLSDLPMQSWPAVRRMLDSSMRQKLRRVRIHPFRPDKAAWKELQAREQDYLRTLLNGGFKLFC